MELPIETLIVVIEKTYLKGSQLIGAPTRLNSISKLAPHGANPIKTFNPLVWHKKGHNKKRLLKVTAKSTPAYSSDLCILGIIM